MIMEKTDTYMQVGIMTLNKCISCSIDYGPEIVVGLVKLVGIRYQPPGTIKTIPRRKYIISALCSDEAVHELVSSISVGEFHVNIKYQIKTQVRLDSFIGTIEEIGHPEGDTVQQVHDSLGTIYTVDVEGGTAIKNIKKQTYIIFREQGS